MAAYTRYGKVAEVSEVYKEGPGVELAADCVGEKRAGRHEANEMFQIVDSTLAQAMWRQQRSCSIPWPPEVQPSHSKVDIFFLSDSQIKTLRWSPQPGRVHRERNLLSFVFYFSRWELYYGPKSNKKLNVTLKMILLLLEEQQTSRGKSKDVKVSVNFGQNQFVFDVEDLIFKGTREASGRSGKHSSIVPGYLLHSKNLASSSLAS
ncbi:hypothetical protein SELMODRAFT_429814 [Selaginella moellendorffii]|uniref:Uncharacterized protein n=1 Tax=Selaginella moellendorffii TaxID=88036 RepID=D8T7D9_SELML|nr:hypothetical protein SELMODRAFT_429814 [Selaginella moellendorffii]